VKPVDERPGSAGLRSLLTAAAPVVGLTKDVPVEKRVEVNSMSTEKSVDGRASWTVSISIDEQDGATRAKARLRWRDNEAVGVGLTRLSPAERYVRGIGDELAVARALSDLSRRIMAGAVAHIETAIDEPVSSAQ
jgi:hypothetical protein